MHICEVIYLMLIYIINIFNNYLRWDAKKKYSLYFIVWFFFSQLTLLSLIKFKKISNI